MCGDAEGRPETQILKATRLQTFATGSPAKISVRSRFARTQLQYVVIAKKTAHNLTLYVLVS